MSTALDRDALYYPYIHIRDVNWLKATLLVFPQVRRIVPTYFNLNDAPDIVPFLTTEGPRGKLLVAENPENSEAVHKAQLKLRDKLQQLDDLQRFSQRAVAPGQYDSFQIHKNKITDGLINFLEIHNMAWQARNVPDSYNWVAVHPKIGEAIMSTIAIALANDNGLDIVTPSRDVHHAVVSHDDDMVFDELIGVSAPTSASDTVDDLAELVMTSMFDLTRLSALQIAELLNDGKDLRRFKDALLPIASSIPQITNPDARKRRLKLAGEEVLDEWMSYKQSLPRFALDALMETPSIGAPETVLGLAASASTVVAGLGVGLGIFFIGYSGLKIWRKYKENAASPYSYLSRIEKAGASLSVPSRSHPKLNNASYG